jgi:ABC-type Mn2+/Zn2+ transport system permease subunit
VLRGLAFLGDALAHGVIPGVALAMLLGFSPIIGAFVAALIMSGLVTLVSNHTDVRDDTAIGLLFVGMLSLGVSVNDITNQLIATVVVIVATILLYRPFLALTFNRVKAQTLGMRPRLAQAALLGLLALSIVASFQTIGTLLVFGLIVAPPATASLIVNRVIGIMVVSMMLGWAAVVCGLLISFHYGTAGGATIAGLCVLEFFVVLVGRAGCRALSGRGQLAGRNN